MRFSKILAIIAAMSAVVTPAAASPIPSSVDAHVLTKRLVAGVNNFTCQPPCSTPLSRSEDQWANFAERIVKL
ncbi:hypothetical protein BG000_001371 [Podila horticola]|nr:hypothetical protein BG000_001371 [Podila horticola]